MNPVTLKTSFDPDSVQWARGMGSNRLEGSALLRTQGGEVRTCAGLEVSLIPVSAYASERMMAIYGSLQRGFSSYGATFANDAPAYYENMRTAICDPQGAFEFEGLPSGSFYVTTVVSWSAGSYGAQGGNLMQRVDLKSETTKVVLTE